MSFIRRFFRVDPQTCFEDGRTAFEKKKYTKSYKLFLKAYQRFDSEEMKFLSLDNAALSAEKAKLYEKAVSLYYQITLDNTRKNCSVKEILVNIDRTLNMIRLGKNASIKTNELHYLKFLLYLTEKDFENLNIFYNKNKKDYNDSYGEAINRAWSLIHSSDTFVQKEKLPNIVIPDEFESMKQKAESIMQRCSLCKAELILDDNTQIIEKGTQFVLTSLLTAHAPISIQSIVLKTGSRGRLISTSTPELPLNLSTGENYTITYSLVPNLPGKWKLGPLSIRYTIPQEDGEYSSSSNKLPVKAKDAEPALKLFLDSETIEEDLEYAVTVTSENIGKIALQNVNIKLDFPEGVKISQGTEEKTISSLVEGETFQFGVTFKFDVEMTHFEGRVIKAECFIDDEHRLAKSSIKLGSK